MCFHILDSSSIGSLKGMVRWLNSHIFKSTCNINNIMSILTIVSDFNNLSEKVRKLFDVAGFMW